MKKLSRKEFLTVSVMLFGLFFGAGNLIFPPLLGNQAGSKTLISLLSFAVTAVVFPVLGVIAVSKTGGLTKLADRVGKRFSLVFTTAIYLSIGPGLGIPRAGSVPFEMAVAPYLSADFNQNLARLIYTGLFFPVAYLLCIKPNKLVNRMGKFLTPSLLLLILFLFLGMLGLDKNVAAPLDAYKESAFAKGFIEGYNTMDAVAALNFGLVISLAIKRFGVENDKEVVNYSLKSGFLAGGLLFVVYAMLSYIGKITSNVFVGAENGAEILSQSSQLVFGSFGSLLMAAIFTLACLTTCVGLITSGSEYFTGLFKEKLSYKAWVRIWTSLSFVVANFGLNKILSVSVPILQIIYPVALVLIIMGISHDFMKYTRLSYLLTAAIALVIPMVEVAYNYLPQLKNLFLLFGKLPLAQHGLAWTLPSLIALLVTVLYSKVEQAIKSNTINSQEASYSK